MRVGVVKEVKTREARVGLTPAGAGVLAGDGHEVLVGHGAGAGAGAGHLTHPGVANAFPDLP